MDGAWIAWLLIVGLMVTTDADWADAHDGNPGQSRVSCGGNEIHWNPLESIGIPCVDIGIYHYSWDPAHRLSADYDWTAQPHHELRGAGCLF